MTMDQLRQQLVLLHPESRLTPLPAERAAALRIAHPGLPSDYVHFLVEVGYGRIGVCRLSIYSGPGAPTDVYDEQTSEGLTGVVLIADDFAGYCIAFDTTHGWTLGGVNEDGVFEALDGVRTFLEFVKYWCIELSGS